MDKLANEIKKVKFSFGVNRFFSNFSTKYEERSNALVKHGKTQPKILPQTAYYKIANNINIDDQEKVKE